MILCGNDPAYCTCENIHNQEELDAATAKLREDLKQEKLDFEKEVSDHYAELHREFKRQLAHQQPSATTVRTHDFGSVVIGSATTPKET